MTDNQPRRPSASLVRAAALAAAVLLAGACQGAPATVSPTTGLNLPTTSAPTAAATLATTVAPPTQPPVIDPIAARVQAAADAFVATRTGVSVYLRVGTDVRTIVAGLASRDPRLEMTPEVRLQIASVTKAMTATIVMSLVEQGDLALSDSVERWIPGLLANGKDITVEQLLTHSSGLFNFVQVDGWEWAEQNDSAEDLVALVERHGPAFLPGRRSEYSNTNYVVLGLIMGP